jgi:hypothetical protein
MRFLRFALTLLLFFPSCEAFPKSPESSRAAALKKWDVWLGDWVLVGTAKDSPSQPEYKLTCEGIGVRAYY